MNRFINLIFIVLYLLVTFFGMGPILFADGSMKERIITFMVVVFIYGVLTTFLLIWRNRNSQYK